MLTAAGQRSNESPNIGTSSLSGRTVVVHSRTMSVHILLKSV